VAASRSLPPGGSLQFGGKRLPLDFGDTRPPGGLQIVTRRIDPTAAQPGGAPHQQGLRPGGIEPQHFVGILLGSRQFAAPQPGCGTQQIRFGVGSTAVDESIDL
jgi:hypothetical protein